MFAFLQRAIARRVRWDMKIRRALISVWDKTGIVDFARALHSEFGIEIISTGGTAKTLREAGIPVTLIEDITGFPELLDGRVKTLHPKIHAAILADRDNPEHMRQLEQHGIQPIDMVVVNLYPFEKTVADPNCTFEQAIEMIDIGGVALLRAAAKNSKHVRICLAQDELEYRMALLFLRDGHHIGVGAGWALAKTAMYDASIARWLTSYGDFKGSFEACFAKDWGPIRYGENSHQSARALECFGVDGLNLLRNDNDPNSGLSYNNYLDADAAFGLCAELARAFGPLHRLLAGAEPAPAGSQLVPENPPPSTEPYSSLSASRLKAINDELFTRRNLPHIQRPGATYTLTFRILTGSFSPAERDRAMECCLFQDRRMYALHIACVMPDHVHLVLTPLEESPGQVVSLARILHSIKGNIGRKVADARGRAGSVLQDETFDHIIRNDSDFWETMEYVLTNPTRARLESGGAYPWCVYEERPDWDLRAAGAVVDLEHVLRAKDQGRVPRPWHRLLAGATLPDQAASPNNATSPTHATLPTGAQTANTGPASSRRFACCFIKHTNPCGVGLSAEPLEAYRRAYLGDPNAAMGGILACDFQIDADFAAAVMETYDRLSKPLQAVGAANAPGGFFIEVWVAPEFKDEAVTIILARKKWGENVRLLAVGDMTVAPDPDQLQYRSIAGGLLVQSPDVLGLNEEQWKVVTKRQPTEADMADLRLAWLICKHTKSNAISICKDGMLIGNGAGQMSRVMSCRIATWLATENGHAGKLAGSAAASDAFFPFRDGPDILIDAGVTAIIQPGGSKRDEDTIRACDERGVAMIFTGTRHFRH